MQTEGLSQNHYLRAATVFVVCLSSVFVWPYLGVLLRNDFFFFSTQLLFPYDAFYTSDGYGDTRVLFSRQVAAWLNVVHWFLAGALFVWLARRWSVGRALLAAIAMIVVVGFATAYLFGFFGVRLEMDGP